MGSIGFIGFIGLLGFIEFIGFIGLLGFIGLPYQILAWSILLHPALRDYGGQVAHTKDRKA